MAGFTFSHCANGGAMIIKTVVVADAEVLSKGEMVNLETGELDAAATGDTALYGVCVEDCDNTADGLSCAIVANQDAVYSVVDANARLDGATLDIAAGGMGVAATSNADLIVVKTSTATEDTLVMFNNTHYLD